MGVIELKPEVFTNPKKGKKVFNALVQILGTQQSQLETLADERKRQEERIKVTYDCWISNVRSLKDTIDQLRRQTKLSEMARLVEAAKTNLVFGLKMKQELVYKLKLENSEDELADFKEWFDILCHKCPVGKDVCPEKLSEIIEESEGENGCSKSASSKKVGRRALQKEVERLKCEYEKLSVKNSSEVSALSSEKEFVWNQYKEMENKYATQLKEKNDEVRQVNARLTKLLETVEQLQSSSTEKDAEIADLNTQIKEKNDVVNQVNFKVTKLLETMEQLQSSSTEKDAEIADLKASLAKMEGEASKKDGGSLKKSNSELLTPVLRGCTAKAASSDGRRRKTPPLSRFSTAEPKAKAKALTSDDEHGSMRTTRCVKRKQSSSQDNKRVGFQGETPKLFSSDFKIPKLKISSLR